MYCIHCGEKMAHVWETKPNAPIAYHDVHLYACHKCERLALIVDGVEVWGGGERVEAKPH